MYSSFYPIDDVEQQNRVQCKYIYTIEYIVKVNPEKLSNWFGQQNSYRSFPIICVTHIRYLKIWRVQRTFERSSVIVNTTYFVLPGIDKSTSPRNADFFIPKRKIILRKKFEKA